MLVVGVLAKPDAAPNGYRPDQPATWSALSDKFKKQRLDPFFRSRRGWVVHWKAENQDDEDKLL